MSLYEVWCGHCDVSFPVGTKKCMHCGGRVQRERPAKHGMRVAFASEPEHDESAFFDVSTGEEGVAEEEESPRRRWLRASMSLVWMVLLAAGYIWQNCAGSG